MGVSESRTSKRDKKATKEKERGPFIITEVHQQGRFYRLSLERAAHHENLKPHSQHLKTGAYRRTWKDSSICLRSQRAR